MKIIECPRDAMQGISTFIPTDVKVKYINQLLKVGFDTIDFGSFVSPKAIPQMQDTAEVIAQLDWEQSVSKLLAIVANKRGAEEAGKFEGITYLGFPLSISDTFQRRNTNKSIPEALNELEEIKNICVQKNKMLVTYISMGFGNPYQDPYSTDLAIQFAEVLVALGTDIISLADTIGVATPAAVLALFKKISPKNSHVQVGVHLHTTTETAIEKIDAAYQAGCQRIDGALLGFGGCPMANDKLVGNMPTEMILAYLKSKSNEITWDEDALIKSVDLAREIFPKH